MQTRTKITNLWSKKVVLRFRSFNHHLTVEVPFEGQCQNVEVNQNNSL